MTDDRRTAAASAGTALSFVANPLDRLEALRTDSAAIEALRREDDTRFVMFRNLDPLVRPEGGLIFRDKAEVEEAGADAAPTVLLGRQTDGRAVFAMDVGGLAGGVGEALAGEGLFRDLRSVAVLLPPGESGIVAQARSLLSWHARHGFCAACGAVTEMARGGAMRRCVRPTCAAQHFPRVDPVVIMLVVRGDKCLLGRQAFFPPGMYSALAGFIEPGETLEAAVRREVMEEAGIKVGRVDYARSQPWPFPSSLMIGCVAEGLTDEITIDPNELETAGWYSKSEVAAALKRGNPFDQEGETDDLYLPPTIAIAHHLLKDWVAE